MEKKIIEYTIVLADEASLLERDVNKLIKEGWQPFGNLNFCAFEHEGHITLYRQAMVKYQGLENV